MEPTLAKRDAQRARMGMKAMSRRATFQLLTKEMTTPPKKVAIHWMKRESFSPIPSWILSRSLKGGRDGNDDGGDGHDDDDGDDLNTYIQCMHAIYTHSICVACTCRHVYPWAMQCPE